MYDTLKHVLSGVVCASALAGCSAFPIPDDVTRKSTYDIVEQIRCEARRAVVDYGQNFKNAAIAYEFNFHITEVNNSSADVTGTIPFVNGGSFGLTANGGLNRQRDTVRNFKIVDSFEQLRKAKCSKEALEKNWVYPIAGDIGMYEVVATFIKLQETDSPSGKEIFTFADTLTFTTDLSGGVKPTLTLTPVTDKFRISGANANLTAQRTDVHQVTLALSAGPQTVTAVASTSNAGATIRPSMVAAAPGSAGSGSAVLATTVIQSGANAKDRALIELDRQRILALQARTQNLLVGP
jgi:hypothetical protein